MRALATRWLPAACGILALALVPVVLLMVRPMRSDPCATPAALQATSLIPGTRPGGERFEERSEDLIQWSEGTLDGEPELRFQILRSYAARALYENPVRFIERKIEAESTRVRWLDTEGGEIPVHVVHDNTGRQSHVIVYLFVDGNEPTSNPLLSHLADAGSLLIRGRRPLTLYLAEGSGARGRGAPVEEAGVEWLRGAWEHHHRSCLASR